MHDLILTCTGYSLCAKDSTVQSLYSAMFGISVILDYAAIEFCYKGTNLQRNYRKMTIIWSFSYKFFIKFHGKTLGATI